MGNRKAIPHEDSKSSLRTSSYTRLLRVDPAASESGAPTTLPPPPFENEAAVRGLEWWLDSHMALASGLHWLQQLAETAETAAEGSAHAETVRRLAEHVEGVRDALYELYCDAADERMTRLLGAQGALEVQVRASYAWCNLVVGLLVTVINALRTPDGPDWALVKAEFRRAAVLYPGERSRLRDEVRGLQVDFTSPIEPLRNLPQDLEQLLSSTEELHATLQKRFG